MKLTFQQQLNGELLRSERKRTIIIISIFLFTIAYRVMDVFLFKDEDSLPGHSFSTVWVFPLIIIVFELFSLLYINRRIRLRKKKIPTVMQYLNTAFEICLPSLIIFSVAKQYPEYD